MSWFWSSSSAAESTSNVYDGLDADLKDFAQGKTPNAGKADAHTASGPRPTLGDTVDLVKQSTKARRSLVNAGAVFNCALAESELNECFRSGSWWDKAKLCEIQKKAFWECLSINKQELMNNGYGQYGNGEEKNAALLEQADENYLRQAREAAAAEGTPS
ncbi:hypothetical protein BCR37DRAFT_390985 [Protomyces lactucae-debilis]|uniref:COX assembly mitochondrial protein n=1 Tax=Protomyces lactucae-debilis TaxID=2754530 RepID=A0A1Y2FU14_PROLT|nr:uncharacterized protein BCR37DRAFT_390985 [Protomyces lactucae-debilis]ORY86185.1 hypothetical protein BCR37DRAFT_390985 [Protomyces lactucae-debilis]